MGSVAVISEIHVECFLSHITHFDPEDGGSMFLQNVTNTGRIHSGQGRPRWKVSTAIVACSNEKIINAVIFLPR
jgi:hypothetical protein